MPNADPPATSLAPPSEMMQTEREIERTRARVSQSIMSLRNAVAKRTDWREWVRENPAAFIAGAFVLGLFFGLRSTAPRTRRPGS